MKKLLLLLFLPFMMLWAQTPIQDTLLNPTDVYPTSTVKGTLSIISSAMDVSGHQVLKTVGDIKIVAGIISFTLAPNDTVSNANSYYIINYSIEKVGNPKVTTNYSEKWQVPTSVTPLTVHDVRVNVLVGNPLAPVLVSQLVAGPNGTCISSNGSVVSWSSCGGGGTTTVSLPAYFRSSGLPAGSWTYNSNQKGEHGIIHSNKLYVPLENGVSPYNASGIGVLDPTTGVLEKFISIPTPCMESTPVFDNAGYLHVYSCSAASGGAGAFIVKVDVAAGTILNTITAINNPDWEKLTYDSVNDNLIILGGGGVRAIRASDYTTVWTNTDVSLSCGGCSPIQAAPILIHGTFVYWRDSQGAIWKINTVTGVTAASQTSLNTSFTGVYAQLSFDSVNSRLYGTTMTNVAFALNISDMSVLWTRTVDTGFYFDRGGAYANGVYYVTPRKSISPYSSKVYALNAATGAILWTNTSAYDVDAEISSLIVDDTYVYVATTNYIGGSYDKILMIRTSTGVLATVVPLLHVISSSIPVAYGGRIIIGLWDQFGYEALQMTSGGTTNDWSYKADEDQTGYIGTQLSGTFNTITDTNTGEVIVTVPAKDQLSHMFLGSCGDTTVMVPCKIQPTDLPPSNSTPCITTVTFSSTPNFDFSTCNQQMITLTGNVTPSITNANYCKVTGGCTITFIQGAGSYTVTWPGSVLGGFRVGVTNTKRNIQAFTSIDGSNIYAITPGIINQ